MMDIQNKIKKYLLLLSFFGILQQVIVAQALKIDGVDVTNITRCHGDSTGKFVVRVSGGTPPYTYSLTSNPADYQTSNIFTGLFVDENNGGVYEVYVKDSYSGVPVKTTAVLKQPPKIMIPSVEKEDVLNCFGDTDGTIKAKAFGGSGTFVSYSIDDGAGHYFQNTNGQFVGMVPAGIYTLKFKDTNGCEQTHKIPIKIDQPKELKIEETPHSSATGCFGDNNGSITIMGTGGTYPLSYSIDGGVTYESRYHFDLLPPGTYQIRMKDSKNCEVQAGDITIDGPEKITITSESHTDIVGCFGDHTGSISVTASGGTGNLRFSVDSAITLNETGTFHNLPAGRYRVAVRDKNGCTELGSVITLTEPDELVIDTDTKISDVTSCFGDSVGHIKVVAHGGSAPLQYSVDGGQSFSPSGDFNRLPGGPYGVLVKDSNGCKKDGNSYIISQPSKLLVNNVVSGDITTCYGDHAGSLYVTTNAGGTRPYYFSVDSGSTFPYTEYEIRNLPAGKYKVVVKDAKNCKDTFQKILEIKQPELLKIDGVTLKEPNCYGESTGHLVVATSGGSGGVMTSPNAGVNYYHGNKVNSLPKGSYTVWVKDLKGCVAKGSTYDINEPDSLKANITKVDVTGCFGDGNGEIKFAAEGGTFPYKYSIDGGINYVTTPDFTGLKNGNILVIVRDAHRCITSEYVLLEQPDKLVVNAESERDIEGCHGDAKGVISFSALGGTPHPVNSYQYSIDGTNFFYNNGLFENLPAGSYTRTVKDENGCIAHGTPVILDEPNKLELKLALMNHVSCFHGADGNIRLEAFGGKPPYKFSFDGGATYIDVAHRLNIPKGTYTTLVKDQYSCEFAGPVINLTEPDSIAVGNVTVANIEDCYEDNDGKIEISGVTGGVQPYTYSISNGTFYEENGGVFTALRAGRYLVRILDKNQCGAFADLNHDGRIDTFIITQPDELKIQKINPEGITCKGNADGKTEILHTGGTPGFSYSIDNGATFANTTGHFTALDSGVYVAVVKDAKGCMSPPEKFFVFEPDSLKIPAVDIYDEKCVGQNDGKLTIFTKGGTYPFSFSIDGGTTYKNSAEMDSLVPGVYYPAIKDKNGCFAKYDSVVVEAAKPSGTFETNVTEGCAPLTVKFKRTVPGITYRWEFGDGFSSNLNEPEYTYQNDTDAPLTFKVTAYSSSSHNCPDTTYTSIVVNPKPRLNVELSALKLFYPDSTIQITNNSPSGYSNYSWDFGDGTSSNEESPGEHTYMDCGIYNFVAATKNDWCPDTFRREIEVAAHSPEPAIRTNKNNSCFPAAIDFENTSVYYRTFQWDFGDGATSTDTFPSHTYPNPGKYPVRLTVEGYCNLKDSVEKVITVFENPDVQFKVAPDTIMLPDQVLKGFNFTEDAESFVWHFGDGGTSTEENPVYNYQEAGEYFVKLIVTSKNQCVDSLELPVEVVVIAAGYIKFPNAFSPNSDGENDIFEPADYKSVSDYQLKVYNRWGERVFLSNDIKQGWDGSFDGNPVTQDAYIWRAEGTYLNGTPFVYSGSVTLVR